MPQVFNYILVRTFLLIQIIKKPIAWSRRSDSGERCKVKGTRKNKNEGWGEVREGTERLSPVPPLLFIAFFTSHRSPLSERLEQAKKPSKILYS